MEAPNSGAMEAPEQGSRRSSSASGGEDTAAKNDDVANILGSLMASIGARDSPSLPPATPAVSVPIGALGEGVSGMPVQGSILSNLAGAGRPPVAPVTSTLSTGSMEAPSSTIRIGVVVSSFPTSTTLPGVPPAGTLPAVTPPISEVTPAAPVAGPDTVYAPAGNGENGSGSTKKGGTKIDIIEV